MAKPVEIKLELAAAAEALLNALSDNCLLLDAGSIILAANVGGCRLFGYQRCELPVDAFVLAAAAFWRQAGENYSRTELLTRTGSKVFVLLKCQPLLLWGEECRLYFLREITADTSNYRLDFCQQAILDNIPDPAWFKDQTGCYRAVNKAFAQAFNVECQEAVGKSDYDLLSPAVAEKYLANDWKVMDRRVTQQMEDMYALPDGSRRWMESIKRPVIDQAGVVQGTVGIARDISRHKNNEEKIRRQNQQLRFLNETALGLMNRVNLDQILRAIVKGTAEIAGTAHGSIFMVNQERSSLELRFGQGLFENLEKELVIRKGQGVAGRAWETGEVVVVHNYTDWENRHPEINLSKIKASIGIPIRKGRKVVGVIGVSYTDSIKALGEEDIEILRRASEMASFAMENAFLYKRVRQELLERKKTEQALRDSELRYRILVETISGWIWEVNIDGVFTYISPQVEANLGYNAAELLGKSIFSLLAAGEEKQVIAIFKETVELESPLHTFECKTMHKQGFLLTFEFNGMPFFSPTGLLLGYRGISHDITERKRTEQLLRQEEERWRLAIQNIRDAVWEWDINTNELFLSQQWLEMFSYLPQDAPAYLSDEWLMQQYHPEDSHIVQAMLHKQLENQSEECYQMVVRQKCKDGKYKWVLARGLTQWNDLGKPFRMINFTTDISELKETESQMLAAKQAISKAERVTSLAVMAAGISHEINQPLNYIKLTASSLVFWYNKGIRKSVEEMIADVVKISNESDRIDRIIRHLRSFVHRQDVPEELCDLNQAVHSSLEVFGKQLSAHGVEVELNLADKLPLIMATTTGLEEIVVNLANNAMQALDAVNRENKNIWIRTSDDIVAGNIVLEVSDNGPGLKAEIRERIFEPFFSTNSLSHNMGLGLSIVNSLISTYRGTITVTDNEDGGASFWLTFPKAQ